MARRLTQGLCELAPNGLHHDFTVRIIFEGIKSRVLAEELLKHVRNTGNTGQDTLRTTSMALPKFMSGWFRISSTILFGRTILGPISVKTWKQPLNCSRLVAADLLLLERGELPASGPSRESACRSRQSGL